MEQHKSKSTQPRFASRCPSLYRPVDHLDSGILDASSLEGYNTCLGVTKADVSLHTDGAIGTLSKEKYPFVFEGEIPFSCNVYEKVFLVLDKEDIEEKDD